MRQPRLALVVAAASLAAGCTKPAPAPAPPAEVYVTSVIQQDVPIYLELIGQTSGSQDVEIRARVDGFLESVNFREGSFVKQGQLLYQIDRKPLQAALLGAQADQARSEATLEKTETDVARYTPLVAKQAVSKQELDNASSARQAARAQVNAAKAAVQEAAINLSYTRVTAPISGLIGTTKVKAGNLVGRGEPTLLTTISQIDPMIFRVAITEADYMRLVKRSAATVAQARRAGIELTLADGKIHPTRGAVGPVEREVDPATGTLGVQLLFPNPDLVLRPGQYGRARVLVDTRREALLVPQRAVQEVQNLRSVAVVDRENRVAFRNVSVGPRVDTLWVIEEGLEPGDQVVAEGLQALRDGAIVRTKPMPVATSGTGTTKPAREAK